MYKLSNFLDNYIDGNPPNKLYFRKGDNFTEIADKINLVFERFDEERSQDFEYLKEVSLYIKNLSVVVPEDKKPVISEITTKLDQILSRY